MFYLDSLERSQLSEPRQRRCSSFSIQEQDSKIQASELHDFRVIANVDDPFAANAFNQSSNSRAPQIANDLIVRCTYYKSIGINTDKINFCIEST